jgi:hypothetical protein
MGRKPKTDPAAPGAKAEKPSVGHNSGAGEALRDDELRALAFQHRDKYKRALEKKKTADAEFKNVYKAAKSEIGAGGVEIIKDLIGLESPEGEEQMRDKLSRQAAALRWAGIPLGTQIDFDLQEPDRTPGIDRAFDEGKQASMGNKPAKPPYDPSSPQYRAFMDGYSEHQGQLAAKLGRGTGGADAVNQ